MLDTRFLGLIIATVLISCGGNAEGEGDGTRVVRKDSGSASDAEEQDSGTFDEDTGSFVDDSAILDDTAPPTDAVGDGTPVVTCDPRPKCDAPLPTVTKKDFRHTTSGWGGGPNHRGRDLFLKPGQKQWAIAKFAYGVPSDNDIQDEDVAVFVLRDCGSTWTKLGTFTTTNDGQHATVERVADTGGHIYLDLGTKLTTPLGVGRHRIHFVVLGDLSATDQYIEVLPDGARVVVSDIDGTLTSSERGSWSEAYGGTPPDANPGAADVLNTLVRRGYYVFYLTARPEWFVQKTRDWLDDKGFPRGIIHTSFSSIGETGSAATDHKTNELADLKTKSGSAPVYGFGNTGTDVDAYGNTGITPASNRYFFKLDGDLKGGTRHDDYRKLVSTMAALPAICK